jgi:hypothetical protein
VKESKSFTGKKVQFDAFLLQRDDFSICRVVFDEPKSGLLLVVDHVFTSSNQAKGFFEGLEQNFEQYIKLK